MPYRLVLSIEVFRVFGNSAVCIGRGLAATRGKGLVYVRNCFVFMMYSTARFILQNVPVATLKYLSLNKLVSIPVTRCSRKKESTYGNEITTTRSII